MEKRIIPDGAHHSGLMKDFGGRYNPDYDHHQEARLQNDREWRDKVDYQKDRAEEFAAINKDLLNALEGLIKYGATACTTEIASAAIARAKDAA